MTARQPLLTTETIAEGLRAGVALVAVVLLARLHGGALDRAAPLWVLGLVSLFVWSATTLAAYWSRPSRDSLIAQWKFCAAPALVTLIVGGPGTAPLLAGEFALLALGVAAVGYVSVYRRRHVATEVPFDSPSSEIASPESMPATSPVAKMVSVSALERAPLVSPLNAPSPVEVGDRSPSSTLYNSPAVEAEPCTLAEVPPAVAVDRETSPTESWTRVQIDGEVSIEAVIHAQFAMGAKQTVVHLPFIPPLPDVPQIECEPLDSGCEVTITTESAFRHGARLSVTRRIAGPAESVPIGVVIYTSVEEEIESE